MIFFLAMPPSDRRSYAIVIVPETVLSQRLEDEMVLLHLGTGLYFTLNGTGSDFWEQLTKWRNPRAAFDQVRAMYSVSPDRLRRDFSAFLNDVSQFGLIKYGGRARKLDKKPYSPL